MAGMASSVAEAPISFEILGPDNDFHVQVQTRSDGDRSMVWVVDGAGISVCQMQGEPGLRVERASLMAAALRAEAA